MGLNLTKMEKGQKLNLSKESNNAGVALNKMRVGVAWSHDPALAADLDAVVLLIGEDGRCVGQARGTDLPKEGAIYYDNRFYKTDIVQLSEDNKTGEGEGDDEHAVIDLTKMPDEVKKIITAVTIYNKPNDPQVVFGQVDVAKFNLYNDETNEQMVNFDLTEEASINTSIILAEVARNDNNEWVVRALGNPIGKSANGLVDVLEKYN